MPALYLVAAFTVGAVTGRYLASRAARERDALARERNRYKRALVIAQRQRTTNPRDRRLRAV